MHTWPSESLHSRIRNDQWKPPNKTTVLVAGDDAEAKSAFIDAITAGGLDAIDAGPLDRARELEALGLLQITLASAGKISWTGGFALVK